MLQFFDEKRAKETMDRVGIPKSDTIDLNAWVAALADQLQIIIHENEDKQEIIVASYRAYLNNPRRKTHDISDRSTAMMLSGLKILCTAELSSDFL